MATERISARDAALGLLARRDWATGELRRRLVRKGYEADAVAAALEDLARQGYLNDARFSARWVKSRSEHRLLGPDRLAAELRQRGIATELVREAVGELEPDREYALAMAAARKRGALVETEPPAVAVRRLSGILRRRGFSWEIIRRVCDELVRSGSE